MDELGAQTETALQSVAELTDNKVNEVTAGCEEILMPAETITNGDGNAHESESASGVGHHGLEFYENEPILPDNDPIEEINEYTVLPDDKTIDHHDLVEETEELEDGDEPEDPDDADETEAGAVYAEVVAGMSGELEEEPHEGGEGMDDEDGHGEGDEDVEEEEEEDDGDGGGEAEGEETPIERTPTQVPKKRKDAALFAVDSMHAMAVAPETITAENYMDDEGDEEEQLHEHEHEHDDEEEEARPSTSGSRMTAKDEVDEEQCRVCTAKDDLVNLFKIIESMTVAEMLMAICPSVSIAPKDFMPQYICNPCLDNVTIAVQLKTQCESTEKELRKKLSRHKNKVRRPTGYVVIDAPVDTDLSEEEEPNDEEYKVSDEASISYDDDSDDSDYSNKKKRVRGAGGKRGRRKSALTPTPRGKKKTPGRKRAAGESSDENGAKRRRDDFGVHLFSSDDEEPKRKRHSGAGGNSGALEFACDQCDQVYTRKASLVLHKKVHSGREPINCEICGKQFKIQGAYRTHLEKHKDESGNLTSKFELRRHQTDELNEPADLHQCLKCKRTFVTASRLERHKDGRCPNMQTKSKRNELDGYTMGKDLFKSVAPLTTTYWSDSFSD